MSALKIKRIGKRLWVVGTFNGVRVRESTKLAPEMKEKADLARMRIESEIVAGTYRRASKDDIGKTFNDAADAYMAKKKTERSLTAEIERKVGRLQDKWGDTLLSDLEGEDILEWVTTEFPGRSPGTVKRVLNDFKAIMNYAKRQRWIIELPVIPTISHDDSRDEHLDLKEIEMFFAWLAKEEAWALPIFMALTDWGVRLGEACRVEVRDIDFEANEVQIKTIHRAGRRTKTRSRRVPMSERSAKVMKAECEGRGRSDKLFRAKVGTAWLDYGSGKTAAVELGRVLKAACKAMGLTPPIRVHDLRHTFAYQATQHGADLGDLQQLMGHANIAMTVRYRGWIRSRAVSVIGKFGGT